MTECLPVDVVGVGLNATDTVIPLTAYPVAGSKTEYRGGSVLAGGQVATAMVACQRWGLRTRYVGKLGDDAAAELHRRAFREAGVEARVIAVAECASAQSLILVDAEGERTVLCRKDDRLTLGPEELEREWVVNARVLHVDGYDTAAATLAAGWARAAGVAVVADLDEAYEGVEDLLGLVDYLIVSKDLPLKLMGETDLGRALEGMRRRYGCRLTAATLGEGGVLAWDGREVHHVCAYRVPVVDTTGAGDVFHAGFIYGLLAGWELGRQLEFGCAAAALNCTAPGARGAIETVERIDELRRSGDRYGPPDAASVGAAGVACITPAD